MATQTAATANAITYQIDPAHTMVGFRVRHMMVTYVRGEFSGAAGTVVFDPANPSNSTANVTIDATTISTREPQRDAHLKSADFLDVEKFPTLTFVSKAFKKIADGEWRMTGDLTIHGVTREVVLNVEGPTPETKDPWGNTKVGASATTRISRKDFGLVWNVALETGGVLVGDEVQIQLEVELARAK